MIILKIDGYIYSNDSHAWCLSFFEKENIKQLLNLIEIDSAIDSVEIFLWMAQELKK